MTSEQRATSILAKLDRNEQLDLAEIEDLRKHAEVAGWELIVKAEIKRKS
jgi:hypothetical protein